jgi:malate dehydrogenase (oxaloacetate-decarboxylating)(NADP+)
MIKREEALDYHAGARAGLTEVRASKPCVTAREMRLAYLPGAIAACEAIAADPSASYRYTSRANLVGIFSNGSAVPGLGDIGAAAVKPMLEGLAVLCKRFADIDAFDHEIDTRDPDRFVDVVRLLEPSYGAVMLKDVQAPEGLAIYERLRDALGIPVFHENLQSTAVVAVAALSNALAISGKDPARVRMVVCGAATVGIGCARLALALGVPAANLLMYDVNGLIHADRDDLSDYQRAFASTATERTLAEGIRDADVFLGASRGGVLTPEMVRTMAPFPVVLALATPEPEIPYEAARAARRDVIIATPLPHLPNTVTDQLSFPYILRGALDVQATRITDGMLLAAAGALADLAREEVVDEVSRAYGRERFTFGPEYLLPKPIDPRILEREAVAVARRAIEEGVARHPLDVESYDESLAVRIGTGRETLRRLIVKARSKCPRVVFPEGSHETILRAASILADEGVARPILLGGEAEVRRAAEELGVEIGGVTIVDPARSPRREAYADTYFQRRARRGVMRATAVERLRRPDYFGALMLDSGDADLMISGVASHYADSIRTVLEVIGPAPGVRRVSSHYMVLLPRDVYFLTDCAVNVSPDADGLAEQALLTAAYVRALGIEPRVAMLSFSNFGSVEHPLTMKVRLATEQVQQRAPDLAVDGEMQLATAVDAGVRSQYFPFARLDANANVLVFPDLQSGNTSMHVLKHLTEGVVVGPVLMGTRLPVHLIQYGSSVEEVVHLTATGIVQAAGLGQG